MPISSALACRTSTIPSSIAASIPYTLRYRTFFIFNVLSAPENRHAATSLRSFLPPQAVFVDKSQICGTMDVDKCKRLTSNP